MGIDANAAVPPEPARHALRGRLLGLARVAISLAILAGLIWKLSPGDLRDTISDADPLMLLAAAALMFAVQGLVVLKWLVLLRARDVQAAPLRVARAFCSGNLIGTVLPTAVGGDVYRIYRVQREANARAADVTMSVMYERATGYGAMTCLGALGAAFHYGHALFGVVALAAGAAAALALAWLLPRMPFPALRRDHVFRNLLAHRRELMAVYQMTIFSFAIQGLYISAIAIAGRALGVEVSWWYWAFATWVVALALLLPITLGGLGVRESSYGALIDNAGATAAQGASTGFALAVLLIAANALGLGLIEAAERLGFGAAAPDAGNAALPEIEARAVAAKR